MLGRRISLRLNHQDLSIPKCNRRTIKQRAHRRWHKRSSRYFSSHANQPKNISISLQQLRALLTQLDD